MNTVDTTVEAIALTSSSRVGFSASEFCKDTLSYLGKNTAILLKKSSELTKKAFQATGSGIARYVSGRSLAGLSLDITAVATATFTLYNLLSYKPSELLFKLGIFSDTMITYQKVDFILTTFNIVLSSITYCTSLALAITQVLTN